MLAVVLSYKIGKILGKGTYAEVYEASRNGAMHAVKVISKNRIQNIPISNEIDALKSIGHKNIIKMHDFYETKDHLYLFLDLCVGGELFDRIIEKEVFTEKEASCIVSDILEAVNYLHSNGIVHRDIKPENILYRTKSPDSDLVLTDFGMSKIITQNFALSTCFAS
jgi:calcium/calmodulin-dependent protein kinase I